MNEHDPLEHAFELLRQSTDEVRPDPALEARLRRLHAERGDRRSWLRRWFVPATTLAVLSGGAFAAGGGVEWLRGWWYGVEIDGVLATDESVAGDGERSIRFESADGAEGVVRIRRDTLEDDALRTTIAVDRRTPRGVEHDESVDEVRSLPAARRHPVRVLDGATLLHTGVDANGDPFRLFARPDGEGGTLVVAARPNARDSVEEVAVLPLDLAAGDVRHRIAAAEDGRLEITARCGATEVTILWSNGLAPPVGAQAGGVSELETDDGRVRVRVENPPER